MVAVAPFLTPILSLPPGGKSGAGGEVGEVFTIDDLRNGGSSMTIAVEIDPTFHRLYNE